MPFLRVIRDKRGYETTYLMHWYREGARQRSRILYVFRTPGGARVGRNPLEPDVLRVLEAQYPDISFDWKAVLDNQQVIEPSPDQRRPRKRRRGEEEASAVAAPPETVRAEVAPPAPPRPAIPSALEGTTPEEQIAFLALWYPRVRERVPHRTGDPGRQEALLALAERLNPAGWSDPDQVAAGLQQAGEALERLSRVFAKRRRRSRKSKPQASPTAAVSDAAGVDAAAPEPEEPEPAAPEPSAVEPEPTGPSSEE